MTMSFVNLYKPPPPSRTLSPSYDAYLPPPFPLPSYDAYGPEPYDINVAFPIDFSALESPGVKLVPFIPRIHFPTYFAGIPDPNHFYRYYPFEKQHSSDLIEAVEFIDNFIRKDVNSIMFAIIDKATPDPEHDFGGSLAGTLALLDYSPSNLSVEFGMMCILPAFQHTRVAIEANGILLRYCFQIPNASSPGLGLRRVQILAHADNTPAISLAKRIGFKEEGIMRWVRVLPKGKELVGMAPRENDLQKGYGRSTTVLSVTWQDWERGGKERVDKDMAKNTSSYVDEVTSSRNHSKL
ncbi:acyl-CoA N-acyltransferase [Hygrophoropsis aurantiaca]|uniref:Acyl-CoA N-acyltransferase n=1 Tax=Hygrophoropsis aurantiaca TaxID=72124 RepID=A0ACB8AJQ0_9AGAM|nr:acyl-CoA N-acyltransferase [Hygrophoropsis aurantiaca]